MVNYGSIKMNEWVVQPKDDEKLEYEHEHIYKFSFPLDTFQKQAIASIEQNHNTLVCVGTGSGKTVVAKYAIAKAMSQNKRVIYTSPIKSLSNQKFDEFKKVFPDIGILTGDIKFNPDAQCVIMTTEILRNLLFKKTKYVDVEPEQFMDTVSHVIFDEVHYINDPCRGKVWEEVIIMLDPKIDMVMLSATIKHPEKFANWVGKTKQKKIDLIVKTGRVIPLNHYYYIDDKLIKILDDKNNFIKKNYDKVKKMYDVPNPRAMLNPFIAYVMENNYCPVLIFCFSRKGCEKYARMITKVLVNAEEQTQINKIFDTKMHSLNGKYDILGQYHVIKNLVLKGIAFHHSGLIPVLKEIIEILFNKGLIKVLFATETFAVGVNMPTKTVVFMECKKYDGLFVKGMRYLRTDEYQQMAGRAGRRGIDKIGTVMHLGFRELVDEVDMKSMMVGNMPEITSKFGLSYQFVLKIIGSKGDIKKFIDRSLYSAENSIQNENIKDEIKDLNSQLVENNFVTSMENIHEYNKMKDLINLVRGKQLKKYKKKIREYELDEQFMNDYDVWKNNDLINKRIQDLGNICENDSMGQMVGLMMQFLEKNGYVDVDNNNCLTVKGLIAREIDECNEIIFTEIIFYKLLDGLDICQIIGVIALFIECKAESYDVDDFVHVILELGKKLENDEYNMYIDIGTDWQLYTGFVKPAMLWAKGCTLKDVYEITDMCEYEGNFVKNIIKINKICEDITSVCEIIGYDDLKKKMENVETLLMRDIVMIESLYI